MSLVSINNIVASTGSVAVTSVGNPIPCTENSLESKLLTVVATPFILLNHFPSLFINSGKAPFSKSVTILSTYQPGISLRL